MAEQDYVERLVALAEMGSVEKVKRLARIVRELLAERPVGDCYHFLYGCANARPTAPLTWCKPCRTHALRERLNAIARGEEA